MPAGTDRVTIGPAEERSPRRAVLRSAGVSPAFALCGTGALARFNVFFIRAGAFLPPGFLTDTPFLRKSTLMVLTQWFRSTGGRNAPSPVKSNTSGGDREHRRGGIPAPLQQPKVVGASSSLGYRNTLELEAPTTFESRMQARRLRYVATSFVSGCLSICVQKAFAFEEGFCLRHAVKYFSMKERAMTRNLILALLAAGVFSLAGAASAQCPVKAPVYRNACASPCQTCTTPSNNWAARPCTGVQYQVPNYPACPPAPVYESCAPCAALPYSWSLCWTW